MKARGAGKKFCKIIARNVEGGADSAPPGPFRVNPNLPGGGGPLWPPPLSFF